MITQTATDVSLKFVRIVGFAFRRFDDQTVIIDTGRRQVHVLNETGTEIWELLVIPRSISELVTILKRQVSGRVSGRVMAADLGTFLHSLQERGLLQTTGQWTGYTPREPS